MSSAKWRSFCLGLNVLTHALGHCSSSHYEMAAGSRGLFSSQEIRLDSSFEIQGQIMQASMF